MGVTCSVMILAYNQERYIRQSIESVLKQQTTFDFEVVIGEDYSTDKTREICMDYAARDPRVRLAEAPFHCNLGYAPNWIRTLQACNGKYIATLEGDDYWNNLHKLQIQLEYLQSHPECGLCITDCDILNEQRHTVDKNIFQNGIAKVDTEIPFRSINYLANCTWILNKELLPPPDEIIPNDCTDVPLILLYEAALHSTIAILPDNTGVFRIHTNSFSNKGSIADNYIYHRQVFLNQLRYIPLFEQHEENERHSYNIAIPLLYPIARHRGDYELISTIENYGRSHNDLLFDIIVDQHRRIEELEQGIDGLRHSKAFRANAFLKKVLHPILRLRERGLKN